MAKVSPKGKNPNQGCFTGKAAHNREGSPGVITVCYLTTSQSRKRHRLQLSPQILPTKAFPPKSLGSSGVLNLSHPLSLVGPTINLSLLQTLTFWFVWPHYVSGTRTYVL